MLKKGDLIIVDHPDDRASWWVMQRDEMPEDRYRSLVNADLVSWPRVSGFQHDPVTSWDSDTVIDQGAEVIPADEWTDEHYAQIAKWALLGADDA
jgi:hypothetical protein